MNHVELEKRVIEEISDDDYKSPVLDFSPFPEAPVIEFVSREPRQNIAQLVSELLAA